MKVRFAAAVALIVASLGLLVACSGSEQYDPPEMVFAGAQDYVKGLEYLKQHEVAAALPWLQKAVAQGNPEANYHIGLLYARGDHLPQDYLQAKDYFYRAAMMGHPKALYYLGHMYGEGSGVEQNYTEALKWFWLAASHGDKNAKQFLRIIIAKLTPQEYAEAEKAAKEIWKTIPHNVYLAEDKAAMH
ncbi:MAG: sel1 repeat family protein [Gammaproteobacteria bacterium]|nr:sel1 repeat family protein [Gammaproteobacteria bacterium]